MDGVWDIIEKVFYEIAVSAVIEFFSNSRQSLKVQKHEYPIHFNRPVVNTDHEPYKISFTQQLDHLNNKNDDKYENQAENKVALKLYTFEVNEYNLWIARLTLHSYFNG